MAWHYEAYVIPLLLTGAGMATLALYIALKRRTAEARILAVLISAVTVWSFIYALELRNTDLPTKLLWAKLKYLGIVVVPAAWLLLTIQYTGRRHWIRRRNLSLLCFGPFITLFLVWTNELHHIFWTSVTLDNSGPGSVLALPMGIGFWLCAGYNYLILLLGMLLLIEAFIRSNRIYRRQIGIMLAAAFVPWMGNLIFLAGLSPIPHLDLTPFAFGITCLICAWALFRLHLTDLVPIAHAAIIEGMDDCVIVLDAQNRIVGLNPAAHGLMNYTASEIIGQPVKLALPDLTAQLKLSAGGGPVEREAVLRIEESQRTFDVRVSPLTDRQGRLMSRAVVLREITHRKWTEERLEGSLSLLNATLESTADGILVVHRSGKTVGYNRKFLNMWHLPDSLVVWGNDLLSHEIVLNQLREPKEFLRKVKELYANPELEGYDIIEFKDGRIFERYTQPRRVGDTIVGRVVSFRDITEHKRLQKQLHETKSHLENLLENANDAIYTLDLEGKLTYVNHRAADLTGYSREELVGRDIASILHPDDLPERLEHLKRAGTGVPQITRLRFIRKEGDAVTLSMNGTPIIKEGKIVGIFGIGRDITREVELEDQLRQAQKLEAVGQLAGGVAHDFNNLLTVILGHTELALMKTLDDSSLRKDLCEVKMAAERAADLTGQLLTFSRKQMIQPKVVDLNVTISRMNRLLRRLVREDIDFRVERAPELWRIMADPNQVEQVIVNLVVNARDAMPEGGTIFLKTDNVEIGNERAKELGGIRAGRYVMLSVTDTGNGMSKEIQKRIFEPFFTTKPEGKGTGLGLSSVYGIVRQHKGGVWVHSRIGQGTTFKAYMPAVDGKDATERLVASPQIPRGFEETILVVEDEESVRGMVVTTLSELGYTVWEAHGGPQALAFLDEQGVEPDLLITDVVMPGIGGEKLAEECERRLPDVQILFISGYTDNAIHKDGVLKEGIEFLQKPFTPLSLALKVRELLANSKPAPR